MSEPLFRMFYLAILIPWGIIQRCKELEGEFILSFMQKGRRFDRESAITKQRKEVLSAVLFIVYFLFGG